MFKKYLLAALAVSVLSPAFCDEAIFSSIEAEPNVKPAAVELKAAPAPTTAEISGTQKEENTIKNQNYQSAINNLDSVQVENRNKLVEYRTKYSEVDSQFKLVSEERKMLKKEIKKLEKEIRTIDKTKDTLRAI